MGVNARPEGTGGSDTAGSTVADPPTPTRGSGPEAARRRLDSLTGLRFIAAFCVFLYHTSLGAPYLRLLSSDRQATDWHRIADPAGGLGVAFFFALSGYVLTWSARKKDSAGLFWRRRFVKIYPNYVVTWLAAGLLFAFSITPKWVIALNLGMLEVWVPRFNTYFSMDPPGWSLGVEAVFYLAFPLLLKLLLRIKPQHLKYWIGGVFAALFLVPVVSYAAFPSSPELIVGPASELQYYAGYVFPPARMFDFLLGVLVALAVRHGRWRNVGMAWSGLLLAGAYVISLYVPFLFAQSAMCMIPVAMLIAAAGTADAEGRFSPFRGRTMVWLGNVSFAFYLMHFLVLRSMRNALGHRMYSGTATIWIDVANFAITLALSAALYTLCERPIVRRWSSPRQRRPVLGPPAVPLAEKA